MDKRQFRVGDTVTACQDYKASTTDGLSFARNEQLVLVQETKDASFFLAENKNRQSGKIPLSLVNKVIPAEHQRWHHGKISRSRTETLLRGKPDGTFLVRNSTSYQGDYSLCISWQGGVEHYHVLHQGADLTIDEERLFEDLTSLVEHYSAAIDGDGLCCQLLQVLPRQAAQELGAVVDKLNTLPVSEEQLRKLRRANYIVDKSEVQISDTLGHGDFGDVRKGRFRGTDVAVKTLRDNTAAAGFLQEASIMCELSHPHLVRLLGVVLEGSVSLLTEYMAHGSLINWLRTRGRNQLSAADQIKFSIDTCEGMKYLEAKNVVHRDLAARNVLLSDNSTAKVADFGLAKHEFSEQDKTKFPVKWTAPEALKKQNFTSKSDVWSFGVLLWEIYSYGRIPYPRIPLKDVLLYIEQGMRMEAPEACPTPIYDLMRQAWEAQPSKRPSFAAILQRLTAIKSTKPLH